MNVSEDEVVARLRSIVDAPSDTHIRLGIGDDAAVWQPSRSHRSVVTSDMLVEGVHFTRETMSFQDAGWRATTANLSDLAAMGARPVLGTVALGVPNTTDLDELVQLYRGIAACARDARLAIVGGDLNRAPAMTIAMTVIGEVRPSNCKTRSGARAGNVVAVTGPLGASRAGLDVAQGRVRLNAQLSEDALRAHRHPVARLSEGRYLGASANVRAMMDCSDGLSTDLMRLCESSRVGARIESVPVAPAARAAAEALNVNADEYALSGGEDFELIVAVERRAFSHLAARFEKRFKRTLHRVGVFRAQSGIVLAADGGERELQGTGWEHFRNR
jgi:thiamine-monophosphate kinase